MFSVFFLKTQDSLSRDFNGYSETNLQNTLNTDILSALTKAFRADMAEMIIRFLRHGAIQKPNSVRW